MYWCTGFDFEFNVYKVTFQLWTQLWKFCDFSATSVLMNFVQKNLWIIYEYILTLKNLLIFPSKNLESLWTFCDHNLASEENLCTSVILARNSHFRTLSVLTQRVEVWMNALFNRIRLKFRKPLNFVCEHILASTKNLSICVWNPRKLDTIYNLFETFRIFHTLLGEPLNFACEQILQNKSVNFCCEYFLFWTLIPFFLNTSQLSRTSQLY